MFVFRIRNRCQANVLVVFGQLSRIIAFTAPQLCFPHVVKTKTKTLSPNMQFFFLSTFSRKRSWRFVFKYSQRWGESSLSGIVFSFSTSKMFLLSLQSLPVNWCFSPDYVVQECIFWYVCLINFNTDHLVCFLLEEMSCTFYLLFLYLHKDNSPHMTGEVQC